MILLKILIAIIILYVVFCFAPGITIYCMIFCRKNDIGNLQSDPEEHFYKGYVERYRERLDKLCSLPYERLVIKANDGVALSADYYEHKESTDASDKKLAMLFHGYRTDPYVNFAAHGCLLWDLGYDLLIVYERGHFPSDGSTSMAVLEQEDLITWTEYCREKFNPVKIVVGGVSMGAATVAYASDKLSDFSEVKSLILDCAFLSPYIQLSNECRIRHLSPGPIMPVVKLCGHIHLKRDIKDSVLNHLDKTSIPVFVLHGEKDKTVSIEDGEKLYESINSQKSFLKVKDAGHAAALVIGGDEAEKELADFIKECENC